MIEKITVEALKARRAPAKPCIVEVPEPVVREGVIHRKTRRWAQTEYCWVDGVRCVYTTVRGRVTVVHLPGGRSYEIDEAMKLFRVVLPVMTRQTWLGTA